MNKTKKIALSTVLLCWSAPLLAQSMAGAPEVNPSWYIQPGVTVLDPDERFGLDKTGWGLSVRVGRPVHPAWDIQFGVSHAKSDENRYDYRQTLLGADALLMLSRTNFRPFLLVGLGAERDRIDNPLRRLRKTSPYYTAGLGFQWDFNPQWSLQADFRAVRGHLREDERFGFDRSTNRYLNIGLNYALGRPAAPPPPAQPEPAVVTPPPQPVPPPPPPPAPRFEKVTLSATELFGFNSAMLTMPQPRLDEIAAALTADPSITDVDVVGYADRLGSDAYNLKLSEQRANAVRNYLVGKGIAPERLKAYGKGEANPLVTCTNKRRADLIKCLEPNRRVEVEQITIERRVQ